MSKDNTQDDYEVGYGKPPKERQFQKGISGNPKGRPKKSLDFYDELIAESKSLMTISENGQRKRISKLQGIAKQVTNKALSGNVPLIRTWVASLQQALGRDALLAGPQPNNSGKYDKVRTLTDEELMMLIAAGLEKSEQESGEGHVSNTE
jgi:Family of unknown function (DUF5681)